MADEILKHFTAAASTYDDNAGIQRRAAEELLRQLSGAMPSALLGHAVPARLSQAEGMSADVIRVLDAGCGTGTLTELLRAKCPDADIVAADFSDAMLRIAAARGAASVALVDFSRPLPSEWRSAFDLIASNSALQWLPDIDSALVELGQCLAPGGTIAFSYFGPSTYRELRAALTSALGHAVELPSDRFASTEALASTMARHFVDVGVETVEYMDTFPSLRALLANIKSTGTRGSGVSPKIVWTSGLLKRIEAEYRKLSGGEIAVTYQISFCTGRRK